MNPKLRNTPEAAHDHLLQYAQTVDAMHKALHRIFTNKKAISESLTRTAAALRTISAANHQQREGYPLR